MIRSVILAAALCGAAVFVLSPQGSRGRWFGAATLLVSCAAMRTRGDQHR